jgi:hypothetical protein
MLSSLLLVSHNHNAQAYSFSWLVDSCVASCKEYAAQFNDLDVWKKTMCVLVGIVAFDKCVSITKGTWNFLVRKSSGSSEAAPQEVTPSRAGSQQIKERASQQDQDQGEEENSEKEINNKDPQKIVFTEQQLLRLSEQELRRLYSVLQRQNQNDLEKFFNKITKSNDVYRSEVLYLIGKCRQMNQKLKPLLKLQGHRIASTHVRPSIVPPLRFRRPDSPFPRRARTNAGIQMSEQIQIPEHEILQKLHERTTKRQSSDSDNSNEDSSSSSSDDIPSIRSSDVSATTPSSSARTSAMTTPRSLDSERDFSKRVFAGDDEKERKNLYDAEGKPEGYVLTPRGSSKLPSPLVQGSKTYSRKKDWSAPSSFIRTTPATTRLNRSTSCQELPVYKRKNPANKFKGPQERDEKSVERLDDFIREGNSEDDDDVYFVTESDTVVDRKSGDEATELPSTGDLSARNFHEIKIDDPNSKKTPKTPQQLAKKRYYVDKEPKTDNPPKDDGCNVH